MPMIKLTNNQKMMLGALSGVFLGFTTFSAFELDAFFLLKKGDVLVAGSYLMLSIFIGLLALWVGFSLIPNKS